MSDERLRVHENTRGELRDMRKDGETYSDVLRRILPREANEDAVVKGEGEMVTIPVDSDIHELANSLAGDGVSVGRLVDFYLFKRRVEYTTTPDEILEEVFNRRT